MSTYNVSLGEVFDLEFAQGQELKIGFGYPASNDAIVLDAITGARRIQNQVMGKVLLLNGAASLPVAVALCHEFAHIVKAIAVRDPKLNAYVVSVSHDSNFCVGSLILIL